ncbi:MAG: hypothetical protein PF693_01035, partial [Spirochaetia bacterium]|nr:hypothetical protein [Spirochaetia bacterium]
NIMINLEKQNEMLNLYLNQMSEIKKRYEAIRKVFSLEKSTLYKATNIEFIMLQIRLILELIALENLVINKEKYNEMYNRFAKDWNAKYIIKDIKRINPEYYPRPIIEIPSNIDGVLNNFINKETGYLTEEEFIELYEISNGILHARNPFRKPILYDYYAGIIPDYLGKIKELLNSHIISIHKDFFFLIHMQVDGQETAYGTIFEKK